MTSLLSVAEVEALMATGLDPVAVQGVIDREEDWLANDLANGIGQLQGERTVSLYPPAPHAPLNLTRPTIASSLTVVDNGVTRTDVVLLNQLVLEPGNGRWVGPLVTVKYTPSDVLQVKRVLFELIRGTLAASPYAAESQEGHSGTLEPGQRERLARSLHPALVTGASIRLRGRGDRLVTDHR